MRTAVAIVCAGCWTSQPTLPPAPERAPTIELAIAHDKNVTVVEASSRGLRALHRVELPSHIAALAWVGDEPVVLLASGQFGESADDDPAFDGRIGRVTTRGFDLLAPLPLSTWAGLRDRSGDDMYFSISRWRMIVGDDGTIWQGHCTWAIAADQQGCDEWMWARVDRGGGPATKREPTPATLPPPPRLAAPHSIQVSLEPYKAGEGEDEHHPDAPPRRVHCTAPGHALDYPPANDLEFGMEPPIVWISRDPPIFLVQHGRGGFTGYTEPVVFEGCAVAPEYAGATLVGGPHDMAALYAPGKTTVRWRGTLIGNLSGAQFVRFAPSSK
jgi:hypothetical protein